MTRDVHRTLVLVVASFAIAVASAPRAWRQDKPATYSVRIEKNVEARMRDEVILRADIYRPDAPGRFPALLQRTPYSKYRPRNPTSLPERLAARGFVVVVQDTRGRYTSDGVASPHDEGDDGYDTVEWVASQPFVDGRVGMFGGSYLATTQLSAATRTPPHLTALFPSSSYVSRYDMVFQGGAFYLADGLSWNLGQSAHVRRLELTPAADRDAPAGLTPVERRSLRDRWLWHVPLKTMDALQISKYAPGYFAMLDHPSYDAYWERFDIRARHHRMVTPALHVTGWYDTLVGGTIGNFAGLRANAGSPEARAHQYLVVGPWTHSAPRPETTSIDDMSFGPQAGLDAEDLLSRWIDRWLKGDERAFTGQPPVRLFVMGENKWRDEQEWPLARALATNYYLHSGGRANTREGDGALSTQPPGDEPSDRYTYDPWDPVPTGEAGGYSRSPADQRPIEQRRDVLVYSTPALDAPIEITGPISLHLWVASSARDTDFTGKLVDVWPDGTARALSDGILRARYRTSFRAPELLVPGQPVELRIDVGVTSNVFLAGHRIRLDVSSSNFPRFDRNPNTGAPFGEDGKLLRADQTIFHDATRPSRLVLPVVPRP